MGKGEGGVEWDDEDKSVLIKGGEGVGLDGCLILGRTNIIY